MTKNAPPGKHDDPDMKGQRARNQDGALRRKRGDTLARTVEQQYGIDLGVRGDKKLGNILKGNEVSSLSELLKNKL